MSEGNLRGVGTRSIFCWEPWSRERYILREAGLLGHPQISIDSEELELRGDTEMCAWGRGPILGDMAAVGAGAYDVWCLT